MNPFLTFFRFALPTKLRDKSSARRWFFQVTTAFIPFASPLARFFLRASSRVHSLCSFCPPIEAVLLNFPPSTPPPSLPPFLSLFLLRGQCLIGPRPSSSGSNPRDAFFLSLFLFSFPFFVFCLRDIFSSYPSF